MANGKTLARGFEVISRIGDGSSNTGVPERPGPQRETAPALKHLPGDRVEVAYGDLAALDLPTALQEALQRVLCTAPDAADAVAALADRAQKPDVFDVVDGALNLNGGGAATLLGRLQELSREEMEATLKVLADLLRHGVVGYEYRKVNGQTRKVFIDVAIGSDLHRAPLVRGKRFDGLF